MRVHQFVVAEIVRPQSPSWRKSDLFCVSHWFDVPADTEFPYTVARMQVFTRFYLSRARPTDFRVRVTWLHAPGGVSRVIGNFGPFAVPFARDTTARDCSFNLHNIRLQGVGVHRIELIREGQRGWTAGKVVRVATTYFVVER
ncbi:hypothetical protein [Frigoriglobus tundricola]|uniref:hypothetical protein n=1 Tax=Frigoriglobus tundricola TaxID=2774151 RepID=UPI00148EB75C|nr:hypothetical protein [Frigoriglobus tundricola]